MEQNQISAWYILVSDSFIKNIYIYILVQTQDLLSLKINYLVKIQPKERKKDWKERQEDLSKKGKEQDRHITFFWYQKHH